MNNLNPAESERLAILVEELGESAQRIGKVLRHGYDSHHPNTPDITNRSELETELADVLAIMDVMLQAGDLSKDNLNQLKVVKFGKITKYLHHTENINLVGSLLEQ